MSLTEIPASRLRVSFEIEATDPNGLSLLHLISNAAPGQFDLLITALGEAPPESAKPSPPEDWSKLVAPGLWLKRGRVTEILALERDLLELEKSFEKARVVVSELGAKALDRDQEQIDRELDLLRPARSPAAPKPAAPKSRAEALVMTAKAADAIVQAAPVGKTVPVAQQIPAAPAAKQGLRERLVAKLRALYRAGNPIPGNKELGDELGVSSKHIGVALAELKRIEAISYEWRPAPTPEDETLQRRFVTRA